METNEDLEYRIFTQKAECDKALNTLAGILQGINLDHEVNPAELRELDNWAKKHHGLIYRNPFREFINVIRSTIREEVPVEEAIEDLYWLSQKYNNESIYYNAVTADLQTLQGICHGVLSDGVINESEINELQNWITTNGHLSSYYPYDELRTVLQKILADGKIDLSEKILLKAYFKQFVKLTDAELTTKIEKETEQIKVASLCAFDPRIEMDGNIFCITGKLQRSTRNEMVESIVAAGGAYSKSPTLKTDYLIVGDNGNPAWAFACYGRKIEQALEMRKKGHNIMIVHEFDFCDYLEDTFY